MWACQDTQTDMTTQIPIPYNILTIHLSTVHPKTHKGIHTISLLIHNEDYPRTHKTTQLSIPFVTYPFVELNKTPFPNLSLTLTNSFDL